MMTPLDISWTALKSVLDAKAIKAQGAEDSDKYLILAIDGPVIFQTTLLKSNANADLTDFETNYKPTWNPVLVKRDTIFGREIVTPAAFAVNTDFEVKATGYTGTAAKGSLITGPATTDLDFAVGSEDRYIHGLRMMLTNHASADTVAFKVVDKDGIIPVPARTAFPDYPVLKQFGFTWNVDHTVSDQGREGFNYIAKIGAGLYMRFTYIANGVAADVNVKVNVYLHKKVA